ncbi:DHH family phosphoesterase, partial [Planktomarina temperata]|nr:single-stranded-DNA-specific exonuclease RecJ [Planktomarina temperata]
MYLGVEQSISNRRWLGPALAIERDALTLHQQSDLPLPLCYVMARLGVAPAEVADFLNPTLRASMSDPLSVKDCATAAEILLTAIQNQQKIAIFADYDVDGGTSAALLIDFLQQFAMQPTLYVPDRITEGYGPNPKAMAALAESHDLIICVDCGTLAYEALEAARAADVVVLDHHLGAETLPEARAVVNPNRQDETGDLAH